MEPLIYNIPAVITGTELDEIEFGLPDDESYDLTYATAKIQFRKSPGAPIAQEFRPGIGTLIIDAPNRKIIWPAQKVTAKPGVYQWDLAVRFTDRTEVLWSGQIPVKPVISVI